MGSCAPELLPERGRWRGLRERDSFLPRQTICRLGRIKGMYRAWCGEKCTQCIFLEFVCSLRLGLKEQYTWGSCLYLLVACFSMYFSILSSLSRSGRITSVLLTGAKLTPAPLSDWVMRKNKKRKKPSVSLKHLFNAERTLKQTLFFPTQLCFLCFSSLLFSCNWKSEDSDIPSLSPCQELSQFELFFQPTTSCILGNWLLDQKLHSIASRGCRRHGGFLSRCGLC